MPSIQRGQTYKLASRDQETGRPLWAYRFRDENGRRRQVGGFKSSCGPLKPCLLRRWGTNWTLRAIPEPRSLL
jgi:hypothetical protein